MKLFDKKAIVRGGAMDSKTDFVTDGYIMAWGPKGSLEIDGSVEDEFNQKHKEQMKKYMGAWVKPAFRLSTNNFYDIKNFQALCRIVCKDIENKTCHPENCPYNYLLDTSDRLIGISLYLLKCLKTNRFSLLKTRKRTKWRKHVVGGVLCWEKGKVWGVLRPIENLPEKLDNNPKQFFTYLKLLPDG